MLHAVAVGGLGWLAWGAFQPARLPERRVISPAMLPSLLESWTRTPAAQELAVGFDAAPPSPARDWLVALRRSGSRIGWENLGIPVAAVETSAPLASSMQLVVRAAVPPGATVALIDPLGLRDSVRATSGGVAFQAPEGLEPATLRIKGAALSATPADSVLQRRAVVLGRASWEAKFLVRALEEMGWQVDTRLAVAPEQYVVQGRPLPLDTARHAVVFALDSAVAGSASAIARFIAHGGGLVLEPEAARLPAVAPLSPGRPRPQAVRRAGFQVATLRSSLPLDAIEPGPQAVVLERRDGEPAVVARRQGTARVVLVGYEDTWRWRLAGDDSSADAHRRWWNGVAASAAYRPLVGLHEVKRDPARISPVATLTAALGPSSRIGRASTGTASALFTWIVLGTAVSAFAAEVALRRARGAA